MLDGMLRHPGLACLLARLFTWTTTPAISHQGELPWEAGAQLTFDGVDDFFIAFPTFSALSNWTLESWVQLPSMPVFAARQCLLHLSTYSGQNIFTFGTDATFWRISYGDYEMDVLKPQRVTNFGGTSNTSRLAFQRPPNQQHVAVTHMVEGALQATLTLYINADVAAIATYPLPQMPDALQPFLVGACSSPTIGGLARTGHLAGQIDEVRHWSVVRSQADIRAVMLRSGLATQWPPYLDRSGLEAQYTFDAPYELAIRDTSGNSNNGTLGGGGLPREVPRYQASSFGELQGGTFYYEVLTSSSGNVSCPSSNCLELGLLLLVNGTPTYNGFLIIQLPTNSNVYLSTPTEMDAPLVAGQLIDDTHLSLYANQAVDFDNFLLQPCRGSLQTAVNLSQCQGEPVYTFAFKVVPNLPPTAGQINSLQLFGDAGFLELGGPLPESGTLELWTQLSDLSGQQTLFSVSRRELQRPGVVLDVPAMSLTLASGSGTLTLCRVLMDGGEQAFRQDIPGIVSTDPQHIAISWEYVHVVRGRAVYRLSVYRNCTLVADPVEVQDACVHFGYEDADLHFPTLGQQYRMGPQGLKPDAFASMHVADIRMWGYALQKQEICARQRALLTGSETGLRALFPVGPADLQRNDGTLTNQIVGGPAAYMRCVAIRLACPDPAAARGYLLRPSVFELPAQPVPVVTSAGYVSLSTQSMLPPMELPMPAFDRNNFLEYDGTPRTMDDVYIRITTLPEPACGAIFGKELRQPINVNQSLESSAFPLYFQPTRLPGVDPDHIACNTNVTYMVVDSEGLESPFSAVLQIYVQTVGPRVSSVEIVRPGLDGDGPAVGDIIAFTFDTATTRNSDWRGAFTVLNGSLGRTEFESMWNDAGDVLMLQVQSQVGVYVQQIYDGSCLDHGLAPIISEQACSTAAAQLGLADTSIVNQVDFNTPEGCYCMDNNNSLFLNTNPANQGRGAETSTPGHPRFPMCTLPGLQLWPNSTQFQFVGNLTVHLQKAGEMSYPVADLSPTLRGSFTKRYCPEDTVFYPPNASCVMCGEGSFRSADGLSCIPCAPGTAAPLPNMLSCLACEIGKYLPDGSASRDRCMEAEAGRYVPEVSATVAFSCPRGTVAEQYGSSTCSRCPKGASCDGPQLRGFAAPESSYFRTAEGEIMPCQLPLACQGWDQAAKRNRCTQGMAGYLCQGCDADWWRPHDKMFALCNKCEWISPIPCILVLLLESAIIWIVSVLSIDAACWGNMHSVIFRLALNYFAAVNVLSRLEEWQVQAALGTHAKLLTMCLALLRFDGGVPAHLMGLECLFGERARLRGALPKDQYWEAMQALTVFWILLPLLWPVFLMVLSLLTFEVYTRWRRLTWMLCNEPWRKETRKNARQTSVHTFAREPRLLGLIRTRASQCHFADRILLGIQDSTPLVIVGQFLILPTTLRHLAQVLACDSIGKDGSPWRLFVSPEVQCWTGEHLKWALAAILGVFIWGVLVPMGLMIYVWKNRERLTIDVQLKAIVGFVSDGYEQRWACWEGVVYIRKVLIILISVWPDLTRPAEMAFYQVIGIGSVILHYLAKPFDNRSGELLDKVELYGLCFFLLQVTSLQFVLLADPGARYDLLSVFGVALLVAFGAVLVARSKMSFVRFCGSIVLGIFAVVLLVMYWCASSASTRQLTSALHLGFATFLNACFICQLLFWVFKQTGEAVAESAARSRFAEQQAFLSDASKDVVHLALKTQNMLAESLPFGTLDPKAKMPALPGRSLWSRIQGAVMDAHFQTLGAKVWFDTGTKELVLGLHGDILAKDKQLTSYTRRKLAASGPFLTDEERSFIAMGLRDALMHMIIECDTNMIHCTLLEFLIRVTFAWHVLQEEHSDRDCGVTDASEAGSEGEREEHKRLSFAATLFNESTFEKGITAADFQAQLDKFTKMSKTEVATLLESFVAERRKHTA